jgi:uncharacterized protein
MMRWICAMAACAAMVLAPVGVGARSVSATARNGASVAHEGVSFKALAFYSDKTEPDHVEFAHEAISFFTDMAKRDGFEFSATTDWDEMNAAKLKDVKVVMWLDDFPHTPAQRAAFQEYMEHGGGWFGFHVAAYNDESTGWPWFVNFLGGAVFYSNNWPPLPAKLVVDDKAHPVTEGLPESFTAPANEWYIWRPSPRLNKDVDVLLTLDPSNYPIGLKDTISSGDLPVVWTNTRYRMVYVNMGHGDKILTSPIQNRMFENALLWLGRGAKQ